MVNFLPHMDLVPAQTQNRINLLMSDAKRELIRQFERHSRTVATFEERLGEQ